MSLLLLFPQNLTAAIGATSAIRVGVGESSLGVESFIAASTLSAAIVEASTGLEQFSASGAGIVSLREASTASEQFSAASALFIRPQVHATGVLSFTFLASIALRAQPTAGATGSETFGAALVPRVPVLLQGYAEEGYTAHLPWLMPSLKTAAIGEESFAAFTAAEFYPRALAYGFLHIDQPIVARSNDYQTTMVSATVNYTTRVLGSDWVTTRVNVRVYQ